jgi:hypothetical protein
MAVSMTGIEAQNSSGAPAERSRLMFSQPASETR